MSQLDLPQIAESQALAYVTSNDADALLEKALCEDISGHDATAGDFSLSAADFRRAWHQGIGGTPGAAFTVTIPAFRRPFMITNRSGQSATVQTGKGASGQVLDTQTRLFYCDGRNVLALSDHSVTGGASSGGTSPGGALVSKTLDQTVATGSVQILDWQAAAYDTDSFHDPNATGSRLTIPPGVPKVQLTAQIRWDNNSANFREVQIYKNGANTYAGRAFSRTAAVAGVTMQTVMSPVLPVTAGDYFEVAVWQNSGANRQVLVHDSCWFSLLAAG
ncbi:hypothetical protein NBZ79_12140 [Sneathiella marina]|uniref:Minor tail protein n=1 Tax=Sneathiella marina TaxID=2950108 RepID=A0ABY4VZ64_9PROT|nr:hypothetical protein [Sneathiella marina]USG59926.1 hypothetical protein NBZ79_12140 [Sneathiella marina]